MSELSAGGECKAVSAWPSRDVQRAYRLAVADVHAAVRSGASANIAASEEEAAMFAEELLRRGEL